MKLRGAGADDVKGVREIVQHPPEHPLDTDTIDTDRLTRLISDVALCLPGLRGLWKLCLAECPRRSEAQQHADIIAIRLALKAYPLPLLDLLDIKFLLPALCDQESHVPMFLLGEGSGSFNNNESKNEWEMESACTFPQNAFDFSEHVQALGLPAACALMRDEDILQYWRRTQQKILAFVSGTHRSIGRNTKGCRRA